MFCVRLAGITVEIDNRYTFVEKLCCDYIVRDAVPAFRVSVTLDEVETYRARVGRYMSAAEAESYLLYRLICGQMPAYDAYLLHAAVIMMDGKGYAFSARRGVGKTTHTALWQTVFGAERAVIVNGDKPLVRRGTDGRFYGYGTPWCGKEGKQVNCFCPLNALCFLEQGDQNVIVSASTADTAARLLEATLLPPTPALQDSMAVLVGATVRDVPAFVLTCRPDEEAVRVAFEGMKML